MPAPPGAACNHSRVLLICLAKKHNEFASLSIGSLIMLKISDYVPAGNRHSLIVLLSSYFEFYLLFLLLMGHLYEFNKPYFIVCTPQ